MQLCFLVGLQGFQGVHSTIVDPVTCAPHIPFAFLVLLAGAVLEDRKLVYDL